MSDTDLDVSPPFSKDSSGLMSRKRIRFVWVGSLSALLTGLPLLTYLAAGNLSPRVPGYAYAMYVPGMVICGGLIGWFAYSLGSNDVLVGLGAIPAWMIGTLPAIVIMAFFPLDKTLDSLEPSAAQVLGLSLFYILQIPFGTVVGLIPSMLLWLARRVLLLLRRPTI